MIEVNGWVSIYTTTNGEEKPKVLENSILEINKLLKSFNIINQFFEIKLLNGSYTLFIGLNHNHDNGYSDSVYKLLSEIARIAIGSYGLVYLRLLEDDTNSNNYKIYKLAKGKVTIEVDELLSPCVPVIEDL